MSAIPSTAARVFARIDDDEDGFLPEGPRSIVFDGRDAVVWVNIQNAPAATRGEVHLRYWDDDEQSVWSLQRRPGFLFPTERPGVLFVGMEKELGTLDLESNEFVPLATIPDDNPRTIINDGEIVPGGRAIVFGTKDTKFADPIADLSLYTLADNRLSVLADQQLCSNGKVLTSDDHGLILYDIDTPTRQVMRYRLDVAKRTAAIEGVALDLRNEIGFPDGMCDGGRGSVIVAFYNPDAATAGRAIRFDLATRQAIEEWTTPGSPRVTCPLLVQRPDGAKLILTTAIEGMPAEMRVKCTDAGNLFLADTTITEFPIPEQVRLSG
jgi:sugar lactone lactonase YvrE